MGKLLSNHRPRGPANDLNLIMSILSLLCYFIQIISFIYWYTHRRDTGRELSSFREQAPIVSALERDQKVSIATLSLQEIQTERKTTHINADRWFDAFKDGFKGLSGQKLVFNNITCDRNDGLELFKQSQTCKRDLCQYLTSCIPHVSKSKLFETVWNINLCLAIYVFGTEIRKKRSVTHGVWKHVFGTKIRKKRSVIPLHNMSTYFFFSSLRATWSLVQYE